MNIQTILIVIVIFVVVLVLPLAQALRGSMEDRGESAKERDARLRESEEYLRCRDSDEVRQMAELIDSIPYVIRATVEPDGFRLRRCLDRLGEIEEIQGKELLFDDKISMDQVELIRLALEEVLAPRYFSSPIYTGRRKERKLEGYYIYLDPEITGKEANRRSREAIYNGERTSDL